MKNTLVVAFYWYTHFFSLYFMSVSTFFCFEEEDEQNSLLLLHKSAMHAHPIALLSPSGEKEQEDDDKNFPCRLLYLCLSTS